MAGALVALVFVLVVSGGGVLYAADGAVPGDALYGLDQAVESARLSLTRGPEATTALLLSIAEERLLEAGQLAATGEGENLQVALSGYGATISSLAQTLDTAQGLDAGTLAGLVDQSFSEHETQLTGFLQVANQEGPEECLGVEVHPVAEKLAALYDDVTYEQIMGWFCEENYGFGEIMHALETGHEAQVSPGDLLVLKADLGGWGRVWQGLGLIGPPQGVPVGPPAEVPAGPPEDKPVGPPEDRPVGPPEDKPVGPPEDRPVGPPEDKPVGPPEDRPVGPPEDRPVGPPAGAGSSGGESEYCVGAEPHPKAAKLVDTYESVTYEQIMTWFCEEEFGMGEIALALKTSEEIDEMLSAGDLLELYRALGGWGLVWQELGLIGKPGNAPAGPAQEQNGQPPGGPNQEQNGQPPSGPNQEQNGQPSSGANQEQNGQPSSGPIQEQNGTSSGGTQGGRP